jgi:serine protease Do
MNTNRSIFRQVSLVVFGLLFGLGLIAATGGIDKLNIAFGQGSDVSLGGPMPNVPPSPALESMNASFKAIAKAIQPTIVAISVKTEAPKRREGSGNPNDPFRFFFHSPDGGLDEDESNPFGGGGVQEGLGSGVVVTSDGYIITNNHVVENAAKKGGVTVKFMDNREYEGTVVGSDPTTDLAVIKIEATGLAAAALGNSDNVEVGEMVLAVGNPLGLESTVTKGIVSSLGRSLDIIDRNKTGGYAIENFIQTDAAINPGNSGGGLFNIKGQVVGINAAIATRTGMFAGYGFAIPVNMARTVAMDIIKYGRVNRGYIGVQIRSVDQTEAEALGLNQAQGVRIDGVVKGGAGELAGLQRNDVVLAIDGKTVHTSQDLQGIIGMHHAGDRISLKVWREGREIEKTVTLKARTEDGEIAVRTPAKEDETTDVVDSKKQTAKIESVGLTVRNLSSTEKDKFGVSGGVIISKVAPASEAYDRGLGLFSEGGQVNSVYGNGGKMETLSNVGVITHVAGQPVKNAAEFEKAVNTKKGKAVALTIVDAKGESRFLAMKVPRD